MTQKVIGPSFFDELTAHGGLIGQHFAWQSDGTLEFFSDTPESVVTGVEAVYEAHDPTKPSWTARKAAAQALLDASDITISRCYENAVAAPATWVAYRSALRAIISASTGDATAALPTKPAYPEGT
jgi:hypothetical protein